MYRFGTWATILVVVLTVSLLLHSQDSISIVDASSMVNIGGEPWQNYGRLLPQFDPNINCTNACGGRCFKADRQKRCLNYCNICCEKCRCVPSGTVGNKYECPCYNNLKNSKGSSKCP